MRDPVDGSAPTVGDNAGAGMAAAGPGAGANGAGNAGGKTQAPAQTCAVSVPATRRTLDLYLVVDTNITLPFPNPWSKVRQGLAAYVDDRCTTGVGIGVRYFGIDCNKMAYASPSTPIAPLPQNASRIKQQIPTVPFMGSATLPALEGALGYSRARVQIYPDSKQVLVLISDGFYDFLCQGPALIQSVFAGSASPSLPVYVLALDAPGLAGVPALRPVLNPVTRFAPLDAIARNGQTGKARHVDLQANATQFAKAMVAIQHDAQPCEYSVPESVRLDPSSMTLSEAGNGSQIPLSFVGDASGCGDGYYLVDRGNASWAVVCPATCADLNARCVDPLAWVAECKAR